MNQVITVSYGKVSGKAKNYPYFQSALYEPSYIKSRDHFAYKLVGHLGTARRSYKLAKQDAENYAKERNCLFKEGIRQYMKVIE